MKNINIDTRIIIRILLTKNENFWYTTYLIIFVSSFACMLEPDTFPLVKHLCL